MKKNLYIFIALLLNATIALCQTATDFTANDCSGTSHHLFAELNAGKVIVVSFVMPCASCIGPSLSAQTTAQSYATSHPGRVLFYVTDDDGGTSCATLTSWASSNGLTGATVFSNAAFKESDYPGSATAMPKVVVIGGSSHHVFFQQDNAVNTTTLQTTINSALATTGIPQVQQEGFNLSVFPNPAKDNISVSYSLSATTDVTIDVYNIIGSKVLSISKDNQPAGNHDAFINFNGRLSNGIYFVKMNVDGSSAMSKFVVDK